MSQYHSDSAAWTERWHAACHEPRGDVGANVSAVISVPILPHSVGKT